MALNVNTGLVSVTGNVTAVGQVVPLKLLAESSANQSGFPSTITLGTVPANKKWHILSISLQIVSIAASSPRVSIDLNSVKAVTAVAIGTATINTPVAVTQTWNLGQCPTLTAAQTIGLTGSTACATAYSITYYEESV